MILQVSQALFSDTYNGQLRKDVAEWCDANCVEKWWLERKWFPQAVHMPKFKLGIWDGYVYSLGFQSDRDAVLFKMFWL